MRTESNKTEGEADTNDGSRKRKPLYQLILTTDDNLASGAA